MKLFFFIVLIPFLAYSQDSTSKEILERKTLEVIAKLEQVKHLVDSLKQRIEFLENQNCDSAKTVFIKYIYSEQMDTAGLRDVNNYSIKDITEIPIVDIVTVTETDSVVFIKTKLFMDRKYLVEVNNVKDKAGNLINPEHNTALIGK